MHQVLTPIRSLETLADLVERLGGIPLERIRFHPPPGTATEQDVLEALEAPRKRICELVDGTLVEKTMGIRESVLAGIILQQLWNFLDVYDLGIASAPDGTLKFKIGLVRIPDVSFISWERIPNQEMPEDPIPAIIPDLAIEVISKGNTRQEMDRKLREYFKAGVRLAWLIYPNSLTAEVYTSPRKIQIIKKDGVLDGGEILPGFSLTLKSLFERATRRRTNGHGKRKKNQP